MMWQLLQNELRLVISTLPKVKTMNPRKIR